MPLSSLGGKQLKPVISFRLPTKYRMSQEVGVSIAGSTILLAELDTPRQHVSITEGSHGASLPSPSRSAGEAPGLAPIITSTPRINHRASLIPSFLRRRLSSSSLESLAISHIVSVHILLQYELSRPPRDQISLTTPGGDQSFEYRRHTELRETLRPRSFLI